MWGASLARTSTKRKPPTPSSLPWRCAKASIRKQRRPDGRMYSAGRCAQGSRFARALFRMWAGRSCRTAVSASSRLATDDGDHGATLVDDLNLPVEEAAFHGRVPNGLAQCHARFFDRRIVIGKLCMRLLVRLRDRVAGYEVVLRRGPSPPLPNADDFAWFRRNVEVCGALAYGAGHRSVVR